MRTPTFEKPRPRPAKKKPAWETLSERLREDLAKGAVYVGSPHHTDVPKYGLRSSPRAGHGTIEAAEKAGLKNPSCTVCPRKWVNRQDEASKLVQHAIEQGYFVEEGQAKPSRLWARDPDDPSLVYEAKLCKPPNGYKAYPLTSFQAEHDLPFKLP